MAGEAFSVQVVDWSGAEPRLAAVREAVFMVEQGVPADLEWDGLDPVCVHALAVAKSGEPIGTARLTPDGHIGRMAVLKAWRGRGVGSALLELMLNEARKQGFENVALNAQTYARDFYTRFGFVAEGAEFLDAGIPHVRMTLR